MRRLAIITTHPIQYNAPWYRMLSERGNIAIKVFYTWSQTENEEKFDPGFGKVIQWDIPLLEGYDYTFVKNVSKHPGSKTYSGIVNPTLITEVKDWNPDAVLIFGWKFKSHLAAIRYFKNKIPVLFRGDSTLSDGQGGIRQWLRNTILKRVYKKIDYALYTGKENRKYFSKSGLAEDQLVLVPHAIDNIRFQKTPDPISFRKELNIPEDDLVFLFAGKLEPKKDPALLATAFMSVLSEKKHLVFVGNGPLEQGLKKEFNHPHIHFLDFLNQKDMPSVYRMADVFVLPSRGPGETWGLAVNEAMACGRPVLVSDKCGCATDLVEDGENGYIFHSGDVDDLKDKIELLVSNRADLDRMGAHSEEIIQNWSFEHIVSAIEDLMTKIAGTPHRRR